ncbi:MAG TPA: tetratricopeptide repeat protein [Thermoanaerobaculia bacterium]|nr:tetratricopeptide repeat protein [Thermoanaerobaculia bacterium]
MTQLRRLALFLALLLPALPSAATCGGGGGGGTGGVVPSLGSETLVYRVSWTVLPSSGERPQAPLALYWFPTSAAEARSSPLQTSRALSLAGGRCVAMAIVTTDDKVLHESFKAPAGEPLVVLADAAGADLGRVAAKEGKLDVGSVEKLLSAKLDEREDSLKSLLNGAEKKASTDREAAIADYLQVWEHRCLFPGLGKKAAKALTKLGHKVDQAEIQSLGPEGLADPDVRGEKAAVQSLLRQGLEAELAARYLDAERLYAQASELDPADATALRFLGELYRHQTGDWAKATATFERVLAMPADPIARAVALHGLGKMTIHAGRFADGLALFERSVAAYPLPIAYRNLAVYWFSERQADKAAGFMRQALALDPDDRYNQIFAAVYLAAAGQKEEAARLAAANHEVLEASYNLAAIWAQVGDRKKAMELLRRHFYEYEQFDAVRAMEMQEARDDYMFVSLHKDPEFVELTRLADGHSM